MGDLLEYFESSTDGLERMQAKSSTTSWNNNFTSCIQFNGAPILPPVMTQNRREEMLSYRRQAMKLENRRKSKQREQLVAKVQSIVAEVEERRLARTSTNKTSSQSGSNASSARTSPNSTNAISTKDKKPSNSSSNQTRVQSSKVKNRSAKPDTQSDLNLQQKSKSVSKSTAAKSENKYTDNEHMAQVKQSKIPTPVQVQSLMNLKRSSSLSSLPNLFQVPKPPPVNITKQQQQVSNIHARRANLRASGQFSFSNPDLRDIGSESSLPSKSSSETGDAKQSSSKTNLYHAGRQSVSNPDISNSGFEMETKSNEQYLTVPDPYSSRMISVNKPAADIISQKSEVETDVKGSTLESLSDLTSLEDNSLPQDFNGMPLTTERQQKISSVLTKLSKCLNIQDTLSTLNSTASSSAGPYLEVGQSAQENRESQHQEQLQQNTRSVQKSSSSSGIDRRDSGGFVPRDSRSVTVSGNIPHSTPSSHNSSASEVYSVASSSGGELHSRATSSSIMSSDSSGSHLGSSKRMSPKGSKSAVHFASFVTEINTSASLSVEDKILVRKLDITPTNSPQVSLDVTDDVDQQSYLKQKHLKSFPKNLNNLGPGVPQDTNQPNSMLDKVALSPDGDSPTGASREFFGRESDIPFHKYSCEVENSTSDKENEGIHRPEIMRNSNVDSVKSSVVSHYSDEGSHTSTLKASQDLLSTGNTNRASVNNVKVSSSSQLYGTGSGKQLNVQPYTQNADHRVKLLDNTRLNSSNDKKHIRHGSYTLSQPSSALLQATLHPHGDTSSQKIGQEYVKGNVRSNPQVQQNLDYQYDSYMNESGLNSSNVTEVEAEREGKAEHIQRYLSQVHEQSLNNSHHSEETPTKTNMKGMDAAELSPFDIGSTIKSFTASLQSVDNLNEEELLRIQADHFGQLRLKLIEQQRQQLEELFVSQRRDQMNLQRDIEDYQEKLKQSQDMENSPENNTHYSSVLDHQDYNTVKAENKARASHDTVHSSTSKPFTYVSSPTFNKNPRDRDNGSDISTFSKGTPKQSLKFTNQQDQTTPITTPKIHKPVLRSPVKQPSLQQRPGRYSVPEKALDPTMKPCFDRVSACVKGYLTRRLMKTEKVQEIIKTIQDTKNFAINFQTETPIKKGNFTHQDKDLLDRIIAQLQASLLDLHEVFFVIPVWERMSLIAQSRQLHEERRLRESAISRSSVSSSQPRISSATLKAIERKRKAHEAELAVFGDLRPVSAPPPSNSAPQQSMDLSGPIRRHFKFLLSRALKPLQGHTSSDGHGHQTSQQSARGKIRPKTAPEKSKPTQPVEKLGGDKPRKVAKSGKSSSVKASNVKNKPATAKTKTKSNGTWR